MQDIDLSNVDAMIVYESDEDVKTIFDVQMGNFDKNSDVVRNEEHSENVINHNKIITSQSKYKILTDCIIERDVDCDIMSFKQNEDNSSNTANLSGNNNKSIDDPEENSMDLVISNVWSERAVTPTCNVKKSLHNETENSSNDNSDSDSDIVSVGNDVDYYSYYYDMILAKHVVKSDLDAKLLTRPVVSLQRIDLKSINKSPTTQNPQRTVRTSTKLLYEKNKELLKQCKACEVSLTRVGRVGRKTRKVKLPDIEKVRKDNQGILTAEVAPLVAGQPRVIRQYGPAQTKRFQNTTDNDRSVSTKSVRGSPKSTILKNTEKTHALSNTVCQNPLIQQQQNDLINNPPESNVQSQDENDGQEWNSNVTFNSISNLTQQISENGLQASKIKNLQTIPDAQDKSTNNIVTNILETQDPSLNMLDTCQVSTVTPIPNTPTMKKTKSTPMPNPPAEIQPIKLPKLPVLIPNPPIRIPKPGSTPVPTVPLLTPPVKLPKFELIPKQSVPTPNLPTLTPKLEPMPIPNPPTTRTPKPKKKAALKGFVPLSNLATLTPKLEPFTPAQYPPEMLTPKLEPGLDPSTPTPNPSTMLTPKTEPFASISSDSTDLDQICAIYSDNYSPISTVAANDFNPFTHIQVTQPTLLNSTLNSSLEPSKHSESSIIQVSLTRSAPIPDTPTSPAASLKPSFIRTHVYKYTKKPCKKESSIKPYVLEFALKQSGNQVILKPINSTKKATTKKEPRKQEAEKGPWRMEHESFDESEFDMDMTFAEAYHLFGESDTSFERSVPLLNLL
ncbi:mucin-2-like isoform X1 [Cydia pomonella]|uniref:mucin-2-like isoform X1 n=1 Tax=Cydia pomonella TaxID=82600 RepID=UPI002ADE84FB|nr:mucin-2-like isoform X1 [Cydia pomonella]